MAPVVKPNIGQTGLCGRIMGNGLYHIILRLCAQKNEDNQHNRATVGKAPAHFQETTSKAKQLKKSGTRTEVGSYRHTRESNLGHLNER